jgi:hypothetical protein
MSVGKITSNVLEVLLTAVIIGVIGLIAYCIAGALLSSGEVDYCYVEAYSSTPPIYYLRGHRSWRDDSHLGNFSTMEETKRNADILNCPILKKK